MTNNERIIVSISGGIDSLQNKNIKLIAATINYRNDQYL